MDKVKESLRERFFEAWGEDNHDEMVNILRQYADIVSDRYDKDINKVAKLKHDFESDLPHRVVKEAVRVDMSVCRRIRWMGDDYGVVERGSTSRDSIPPSLREEVYERDDHQCIRCGDEHQLEIHHIIPVSHGGLNFKDNLVVLCESCNYDAHAGDYSTRRCVYSGKREFWKVFIGEYSDSD